MEEIRARLSEIADERHPSYVRYPLADILIIVMCSVLCGLDTLGDSVIYAKNKKDFLAKEFGIEKVPSKATFARVLSSVNGKEVGDAILDILRMRFGAAGEVIAVDGKAICSTTKPGGHPHSALQILSAYMTDNGVVLAQEAIHEKTNEIPVFQEMLTYLDVEGKTVTADAMHCQRETCRRIIRGKGNYLFGLKENQPSLLEDVRLFFEEADAKDLDCFQTVEKNAGRIEKRVCRKIKDISWPKEHKWPGLQSVFSIERTVEIRGRSSRETSYYISSCNSSPQHLMALAREHWKVESMHWLLDVTFSEDACRFLSENAHRTLNALRKFALTLHKNFLAAYHKKSSIKAHMLSALLYPDLLLSILHFL